ncbi:hypothetical protein [Jannaschia sp. W003]|uniref:hypothetical protein n=1 Tax=Jannaschia sp. W003 TaxID=2867012 RepID=UPI0021A46DA0|nr:hypothetical protein [Jannaschia sp. W003]UWQ20120.1 hypothetical protein K3554_08870 [Jannaschia sp. W003]
MKELLSSRVEVGVGRLLADVAPIPFETFVNRNVVVLLSRRFLEEKSEDVGWVELAAEGVEEAEDRSYTHISS